MKMGKFLGMVACAAVVTSCATHSGVEGLTGEQRARLNTLEIIRDRVTRPYQVVATVTGSACQKEFESKIALEDDAIEQVKLEAVVSGADALINLSCRHSDIDFFSNCMTVIECSGDAIRYQPR